MRGYRSTRRSPGWCGAAAPWCAVPKSPAEAPSTGAEVGGAAVAVEVEVEEVVAAADAAGIGAAAARRAEAWAAAAADAAGSAGYIGATVAAVEEGT